MSAIPFTDRELKRAWREHAVFCVSGGNQRGASHRLLLFYAVECGLKVVWLKRRGRTCFGADDIARVGHDLRRMLRELRVAGSFSLSENLLLDPIRCNRNKAQRACKSSDLHQVWRYGGKCVAPTDFECEQQLRKILNWIDGELK